MAATQAFLNSRASQANLSASAAATALRTLSPTPTPVDQVQTKRMIQRQASLGALSGSARGRSRGGLQRQNSAGSMTERSFRTPSPSPSRQLSRPEAVETPPLPDIPRHFTSAPAGSVKKKKRASSQEPLPPRVLSPPPSTRPAIRGQSLDRYGVPQQPPVVLRSNHIQIGDELERTDSRNSINFSRPLSPRPQSPTPQSPVAQAAILTNGAQSHSNAVARAIHPAQAEDIQYSLMDTAYQPVKKKKKKVAEGASEGSHLHTGTMASKPIVTPLEPGPETDIQRSPEDQPKVRKKKKKASLNSQPNYSETSSRTDSDSDSAAERSKERRAQRASGILTKQPSIVREDWEGEQQEEGSPPQGQPAQEPALNAGQDVLTPLQTKRISSAANVSRKIEEPPIAPKPVKQPISPQLHAITTPERPEESPGPSPHLQVTEPPPARGTSLSPSRSTRFSDRLSSDLAAGRKHEPLPRSVSPAKSALKHHSPAPGGHSGEPYARGSSVTPSESSDISNASADGLPKRKKSVRVSFDSQPEIVGGGATGTPQISESPNREKKAWLGLGKSKPTLTTIPSNDDMEELMKPRPQLPSFGSVRGQKFRDASESITPQSSRSPVESRVPATAVESKVPSSLVASSETSSGSNAVYRPSGVSSDHAVGAVLAQEARKASQQSSHERSNEPLPPEVVSVQGAVSFSDSEGESEEIEEHRAVGQLPNTTSNPRVAHSQGQVVAPPVELPGTPDVPVVSVSPPTPAPDESRRMEMKPDDQFLVEVPGGFPVSADNLGKLDQSTKDRSDSSGFTLGPGAESTSENESDNDSIYSDAAEDPSELEGTGFGSIDAIVDSPMRAQPQTRLVSPPESPIPRVSQPAAQVNLRPHWEETQARWSGIVELTRNGAMQTEVEQSEPSVPTSMPKPPTKQSKQPSPSLPPVSSKSSKRKKKSPAELAAAASVPAALLAAQGLPDSPKRKMNQTAAHPTVDAPTPELGHAAAVAAATPFRQSMRASSPPEVEPAFRKTMRNENRNSKVPAAAPPQQQRQQPPAAVPAPTSQPRAALQKRHIPATAAAQVSATAPRVQPTPAAITNDSDSESSFRKARRSKSTTGGKYTMRHSMRGTADSTLRDSDRNGVRSLSPVGRRPLTAPEAPRAMRTSMRGTVDTTPSLRASMDSKRQSSMFARQKSPPPVPSIGIATSLRQKNRSRIQDSDDEDAEPKARTWRSRFAEDSDDEADVTHFAPVRGIPRRGDDGDSTDLEDSSEEEKPRAPGKLEIPPHTAPAMMAEPLSPNSEKKRGLFGMFRSKKPKEEGLSPVMESPAPPVPSTTGKPSQLGFASAAERDRMIELTRAKLEAAKEQQTQTASPQTHGKLHRRQTPQRIMSDSWPLPPELPDPEKARPSTADGPPYRNGSTRLNQGSMRMKQPVEPIEPVGRSGKKKRFPMLRKAFGLKD